MVNPADNPQALVNQVRQILAEKGQQDPGRSNNVADASAIDRHLQQVTLASQTLPTGPDLRDSPSQSIPILGPLLARMRRQAHELTLFYVNRAASHQISVNHELQGAVAELRKVVDTQEARIAELERQLHEAGDGE